MIGNSSPQENVSRIEPCRIDPVPAALADRAAEVAAEGAVLGRQLHPATARSLGQLVRVMNCYYSNLIEGHNTRPRDIERALAEEFDDGERRDLQLEARAHIRVQTAIDLLHADGSLASPASRDFVRWLHGEFYRDAPQSALAIQNGKSHFSMVPGEFRGLPEHDNLVGRHHPPSSARVEEFMEYFERRFDLSGVGAAERLIAWALAHHRFNFIHPFPDGNGRVSRLMSHAMALGSGIGAHGLWSIARGMARGLTDRSEYKMMMDHADMPRQGDLDGRGNLSNGASVEFATWFLNLALDQIRFMSGLYAWEELSGRLDTYVLRDLGQRQEASDFVQQLFLRGEMTRGEVASQAGLKERTARTMLADLVEAGLVGSTTPKGPISLRFGTAAADRLFPRLFPAQA